ncbi:MAG: membrane protein insertase YidC [Bacteroidota bacterium]|nr:membrane protein insertase YidC [Bacteroidota bacterium]
MDKNSVIGFSLLVALLLGYLAINNYEQKGALEKKQADSIAYAKTHPKIATAQVVAKNNTDTLSSKDTSLVATPVDTVLNLDNAFVSVDIHTKGGNITKALLKNYKTYYQKPLVLFDSTENQLSFALNTASIKNSNELYYTPSLQENEKGKSIVLTASINPQQQVVITYTLETNAHHVTCSYKLIGFAMNTLVMNWDNTVARTEKSSDAEKQNVQEHYKYSNGDQDYFSIRDEKKERLNEGVQWIGLRTGYFSQALIAKNNVFNASNCNAINDTKDTNHVVFNRLSFQLPLQNNEASMDWYIGPNDYATLKSYQIGLEEMVPLGTGIFAFVKYVNKWLILPMFNLLNSWQLNLGLIIILMTLIIRLALSFFTYKSYLSTAKMRLMKPELDVLREKFPDQQAFSVEQMKLYRSAGVNPLGGCLPMLFQLPFLVAMYCFIPTNIVFRQVSFLWADDLSTFDSILNLPFSIPLYGDHVSLFTLLMTASSLFLALYNRNMTPQDPNNPMMKYLPFVFPIMLMGVFNKMAAALTFYYFFGNMVSIAQQFIIQKLFINEEAIHKQLQENKNKPATASKWQQKLEEMQRLQQEKAKKK